MDCAKLVCVDSKLVLKDKAEAEGEAAKLVAKYEDGQGEARKDGFSRCVESEHAIAVIGSGSMDTVTVKVEDLHSPMGFTVLGFGAKLEEDVKTESA